MAVETAELLEFVKDVLHREDRTLGDEGVILCDEVRSEGIRLLHEAGWKTQEEEDDEALDDLDLEDDMDEEDESGAGCYYGESVCQGELWTCETCNGEYCQTHWHQTSKGTNVECVACERERLDALEE